MRTNAWTENEDKYLAETVLRHIDQRSTQLKAFEEAGDRLDRSAAACGFRWNATLRNKYQEEIKLAKRRKWGINPNAEKIDKGEAPRKAEFTGSIFIVKSEDSIQVRSDLEIEEQLQTLLDVSKELMNTKKPVVGATDI